MKKIQITSVCAIVCLSLTIGAPLGGSKWSKKAPSFLLSLYKQLTNNKVSLSMLGASRIHGIFNTVKQRQSTSNEKVYDLTCSINGTNLSLYNVFLVNLHLTVMATRNEDKSNCNLALHDIFQEKNHIETDKLLQNDRPSLEGNVSGQKWIASPSTNAGVRVSITPTYSDAVPIKLPHIDTRSNAEPPYFIIYI